DDIVVGSEGPDKHKLGSGFDWVTYKEDLFGVSADLFGDALNAFPVPQSVAAVQQRYAMVEGLSGSAHADILRGDNETAETLPNAGARGSVLSSAGMDLIAGLRDLLDGDFDEPIDSFGSGNILLGGAGSDILEGRGGDDVIDGDAWLNVRVSVRDPNDHSVELFSVDRIKSLVSQMVSGEINPGQLEIVREILVAEPGEHDVDTAVFSDLRLNYIVEGDEFFPDFNGFFDVDGDGFITVTHLGLDLLDPTVSGIDGVDRLKNIERLQFNDTVIIARDPFPLEPLIDNAGPQGEIAIYDAANNPDDTPVVGQYLRASIAGVTDADNPGGAISGPVSYIWQAETLAGSGVFTDIIGP